MSSTQEHHQQLKDLLAQRQWDEAEALWLDVAEQFPDQPEFPLLLIRDFSRAGRDAQAAALAALIAPNLKAAGKLHEWLLALKLQAVASPNDKSLRHEFLQAYQIIYEGDPRLKSIVAAAGLDQPRTPLPVAIAKTDTLLALNTGAFCRHKSWGFGRIKAFDATLSRIVVTFPHNPEHAMQLPYAAESLTPVSPDHIDVRKIADLDSLKQLATADPLALLRIVLLSFDRAATAERIEAALSGSVIAADQWKKWWDNARKLAKRDPHFVLPSKKTEPVSLRDAPVSKQDDLLEAFREAPSLGQKTEVTRSLLKIIDEIADPEVLLLEFQDGLLQAIRDSRQTRPTDRVEAALLLEDLRTHLRTPPESGAAFAADLLSNVDDLPALLDDLSTPSQKRVVALLKERQPERLLKNLNKFPAKILDEISDLLPREATRIEQLVRNQTASTELLCWICRNLADITSTWLGSLPRFAILLAVLNAIESGSGKPIAKLYDLLMDDETLLPELLVDASTEVVRNVSKQILGGSTFEELDRRSLMARVVKEYPFVQEFLVTKSTKEQPLTVSWPSYQRRKAELEQIIQKKIPQNSKEIAQARSYGDLRENFEFKAAKETQRLLMRRRVELETQLARAVPTDFANVAIDSVQIGTSVTVTDLETNQQQTHHILGAWDSDPDRGIISYPAALAQALLNKRVGDTAEWQSAAEQHRYRIERIDKVPAEILQSL